MSEFLSELDEALGEQSVEEVLTPAAEVPRDEQGRFASQQPDTPDSEPEPATEEEQALLAGRFKSPEELERGYTELLGKFSERDDEIGELRRIREEYQAAYEQQAQPQQHQQPITQQTVDWLDEQTATNPQAAAYWAMQSDPTGALYDRVMTDWYETQPRSAAAFERQLEMAQMAQAVDQRITSVAAPLEQQAHTNDFVSAWAAASQQLPDLTEHSEAILEAAQSAPEVLQLLQSGTQQDKQRVIENLYYLAKGKQATSLNSAAQQMAAQQAQESQAAKDNAFVASSGQRNEPETSSAVDRWFEEVLDPALKQYT